jgi:hypothetical protein
MHVQWIYVLFIAKMATYVKLWPYAQGTDTVLFNGVYFCCIQM